MPAFLKARMATSVAEAVEQELDVSTAPGSSSLAFPGSSEIRMMALQAAASKNPKEVEQIVTIVLQALGACTGNGNIIKPIIQTASLLCRTCREMGLIDAAREILERVLKLGPLSEADYYTFEPLLLLEEQLIPEMDAMAYRHDLSFERLKRDSKLYLVKFQDKSQVRSERGFAVGKKLLELSFALNWSEEIDTLYFRCLTHHQDDVQFTEWFLTQLHETGQHRCAIRFFILTYSKMSPSFDSIERVGNLISLSVSEAQGYKAGSVLRVVDKLCYGQRNPRMPWTTGKLHTTWIMRILDASWEKDENFDETAALFATLRDRGALKNVVNHPMGLWRTMMDIAFKAGRQDMVETYYSEATAELPAFETHAYTIALLAQAKAKAGDWDGVERYVEKAMASIEPHQKERFSRRFVPILAMFAEGHTVAQTDAFLRHYVTNLKVPLCRDIFTFMAKEYGVVRDIQSLVAWLEYCAEAGFKIGAAFSNTILSNCRRWNFPLRQLRNVYIQLRRLSPDFTDKYTERMMYAAAFTQAEHGREPLGALKHMSYNTVRLPKKVDFAARTYSADDIVLSMREELVLKHPKSALSIYRRALRRRMDLCGEAVRLAVKAAVELQDYETENPYEILREAEQRGVEPGRCAVPLIMTELHAINPEIGNEERYRAVRHILDKFTEQGIKLSDIVLNNVAYSFLRRQDNKDANAAVNFALMAAQATEPKEQPCYNEYNFSVFILAFVNLRNVDMLGVAIAEAKKRLYWTETFTLRALKHARLVATRIHGGVEMSKVLKAAIHHCVRAREQLGGQRRELQSDCLDIMRRAAETQRNGLLEEQQPEGEIATTQPADEPSLEFGEQMSQDFDFAHQKDRRLAQTRQPPEAAMTEPADEPASEFDRQMSKAIIITRQKDKRKTQAGQLPEDTAVVALANKEVAQTRQLPDAAMAQPVDEPLSEFDRQMSKAIVITRQKDKRKTQAGQLPEDAVVAQANKELAPETPAAINRKVTPETKVKKPRGGKGKGEPEAEPDEFEKLFLAGRRTVV
jgi:tetratricopeptide (TPR) repeat protein